MLSRERSSVSNTPSYQSRGGVFFIRITVEQACTLLVSRMSVGRLSGPSQFWRVLSHWKGANDGVRRIIHLWSTEQPDNPVMRAARR